MAKRKQAASESGAFDEKYPHIADWVLNGGRIELGGNPYIEALVYAIDEGGVIWEGVKKFTTLEDAFRELDAGIAAWSAENV
jgi:hypothetical protein